MTEDRLMFLLAQSPRLRSGNEALKLLNKTFPLESPQGLRNIARLFAIIRGIPGLRQVRSH
jgi:hypothetical protein